MMTAKVDDGSSAIMDELFSADDECNDVLIDLESFWRVMGDPAEASQGTMLEESPPFTNSLQVGLQNSEEVLSPRPGYGVLSPVQNSEASECRTGCSDGSSESAGISVFVNGERLEPPSQLSLPEQSCSRSVADCTSVQGNANSYTYTVGGFQIPSSCSQNYYEIAPFGTPNHSDALSSYSVNNFINDVESSEICHLNSGEELLRCPGTYGHSERSFAAKVRSYTTRWCFGCASAETPGSFIDGEPIIKLPPKTIELKKVDFSEEERDFYCRLEADSRAQFAEYAAAGTVKQNYVNILLMLLRLRQACDHPLLVKGFSPNSQMTSSIEVAKKLPREKHIFLLNCLEASLAICGICSDPPEDAVVTVCGHVFCNQCICEHMIGDDTQCPPRISVEKNPDHYDSEVAKVSDSCSLSCPHDSSKIKAALKLLLSLSKPHDPALRMSSIETMGECYSPEMLRSCDPGGKNGTSNMTLDSENSVKVVGEKAIVFSQWTRMLDLLEACLKNSSIQYRRLDGTMAVVARDRAVKDFNFSSPGFCHDHVSESCQSWTEHGGSLSCHPPGPVVEPNN
ncbi:Helicase-like transcription factor CHR27 [Sesamum angolense]|uniref:Helicase-like transcription factor CHR27 n=1 Tax=Sesamum angolense TaxID=2727404 RepID=A0AAE1WTM6_9LAMI|nr:Helicase-like transcription factor CHR27 [Sesamum angolense]